MKLDTDYRPSCSGKLRGEFFERGSDDVLFEKISVSQKPNCSPLFL